MDDTAKFCPLSVMPLYDNQQKHSPKQLFWIKEPLQRYSQFVSFQMSNQHFHKMELSMCGVLCSGHTSCCLKIEYNFFSSMALISLTITNSLSIAHFLSKALNWVAHLSSLYSAFFLSFCPRFLVILNYAKLTKEINQHDGIQNKRITQHNSVLCLCPLYPIVLINITKFNEDKQCV